MATLENIRNRAGVLISVIIAIALLSFLINPQDIINYFQSSRNNVGEISGKKIDIQEFQKSADHYSTLFSLLYGGSMPSEEESEMARNGAWERYIREYVLAVQYEKAGVGVSLAELKELAAGKNLSPILRNIPDFYNMQTGETNWENLTAFWKNEAGTEEQRATRQALIVYFENEIKEERLSSKYNALITKANYVNDLETKRAVKNAAYSVEFSYVTEPFMSGKEADSLYRVKESEAKEYYNKNKKKFEQGESRDIEFVSFPVLPSEEDRQKANAAIEKLAADFATAQNPEQFVKLHTDVSVPFDYAFYRKGELSPELDSFAFTATKADMLQPIIDGDAYKIARINDVKMLSDSVNLRMIVLQPRSQEQAQNPALLLAQADSIAKVLRSGSSWGELAIQFSAHEQSALQGGEVGWVTQKDLSTFRELADSAFFNPAGKIMTMLTPNGAYIFQTTQKTKEAKKVQLAVVGKEITAGRDTYDNIYNKANLLASQSQNSYEAFKKLAEENGYAKQSASMVQRGSKQVQGMPNARPIVSWAFGPDVKEGSVSGVIDVDNSKFVVAAVTGVREEGIAPFSQLKNDIAVVVMKEKQAKALTERMNAALASATTIDEVASKLGKSVQYVSEPVTFQSYMISGLGFEPLVAAAATSMGVLNKPSSPVTGENGVFVLAVTSERKDEGFTEDMARNNIERQQMGVNGWQMQREVLLKSANVKDRRARFY